MNLKGKVSKYREFLIFLDTNLGPSGSATIASYLAENPPLLYLFLGGIFIEKKITLFVGCFVTNAGVASLCKSLESNSTLIVLSLKGNKKTIT